jgi:hypothetical protein
MALKKVVRLTLIRNERDHKQAKEIRAKMGDSIKSARAHLGDGLIGYGMVAWDKEGKTVTTVVNRPKSPLGRAILPRFVKDKLEQHITEDFTVEGLTDGA